MVDVLIWWVLIELTGLAVWPVAFRFFRNLPGRGYAFIKPLGLLLIAYPFWLLTTLGFLDNTRGAIALVALLVAAVSWWLFGPWKHETASAEETIPVLSGDPPALPREIESPVGWLAENKLLVVVVELVFTIAFIGWCVVRAYMPEITATEKPMEFAFLNGVLQSTHFPPLDPWLAGYPISYYYFGYVIVAMLTLLSGVASSIAFNLGIALLFGLSATGAFGVAYDLIRGSLFHHLRSALPDPRALFFSLFAPIFLLVIGNLEGVLEALHARGLGTAAFWNWIDVKDLSQAPVTGTFVPTDNWWWWRASRVVHDVIQGKTVEVIDEFPQFSFLLGDMHPHVLALPFVFVVIGVALNIIRQAPDSPPPLADPADDDPPGADALQEGINGVPAASRLDRLSAQALAQWRTGRLQELIGQYWLLPVVVGALGFLNSWDMPTYAFVVVVAFAVARYRWRSRWDGEATRELVLFVLYVGFFSLLLYLPFYIGFQSQAGGILPVLFVKTRLHQYLLMFGFFVFVLGTFAGCLVYEHRALPLRAWLERGKAFIAAMVAFPIAVGALALAIVLVSPSLQESLQLVFPDTPGRSLLADLLAAYLGPLLSDPWLYILLVVLLTTLVVLFRLHVFESVELDTSTTFVLILAFAGFLLTFGVEFVYLRDVFMSRMNTVFKFYFQAWTLFSIAGAYAVYYLSRRLNGLARVGWFTGLAVLLAASLVYPIEAIPSRADGFDKAPTLDGIQWIQNLNPSDYAAIQWLDANAPRGSRILESTGREYSYDDRISMATGLPTVLGWPGHETQWHGNSNLFDNKAAGIDRAADVARIYQTTDPQEALTLINKYAIKFVVIGDTERSMYGLTRPQIDKFGKIMTLVFQDGDLRIYASTS